MVVKENPPIMVPYSTGRNYPKYEIPANACDSHHHIYDPVHYAYCPTDTRNQPPSTVDCYRMLQKRIGTERNVIIQPSVYKTDNRCTLAALAEMGDNTRAIVVIDNTTTDAELQEMDRAGVRGVRLNINCGGSNDWDMIQKLAERIAPLNWVMCFWMSPELVVEKEEFLRSLPCQICFDHRGHIPAAGGVDHPACQIICRMLKEEKCWVKLSGLYIDTNCEDYADTIKVGQAYVAANVNRCLWGTDWPHPSSYSGRKPMPNDVDMLDDLMIQAGSEENFRKILVDNPAKLFF